MTASNTQTDVVESAAKECPICGEPLNAPECDNCGFNHHQQQAVECGVCGDMVPKDDAVHMQHRSSSGPKYVCSTCLE